MSNIFCILIVVIILFLPLTELVRANELDYNFEGDFKRGINLGNALEAPPGEDWGVTIEEYYLSEIKQAGFDHVRIPIRWSARAERKPPYNIDQNFMDRVQEVVHWALEQELGVIINIHHYEQMMNQPRAEKAKFLALWEQISEHFQDYPEHLKFELLNEPHDKLAASEGGQLWNEYIELALDVIRELNPERKVIFGPINWYNINHLNDLTPLPDDDNIIVAFHYYNPFEFTHQGASWAGRADQTGFTWLGTEREKREIREDLDKVIYFGKEHDVSVRLGEFGAYSAANKECRVRYTDYVARQAEERNIPWTYWEWAAGFGIYDQDRGQLRRELYKALIPEGPEIVNEIGNLQWDVDEKEKSISINLNDKFYDDTDGTDLAFSVKREENNLMVINLEEGILNINYIPGSVGKTQIQVEAQNKAGFRAVQNFMLRVLDPTMDDLALFRPVSTSSTTGEYKGSNVTDGARKTEWRSKAGEDQWFEIDLETIRKVERINLNWGERYALEYTILFSEEGKEWTVVHSEVDNRRGINLIDIESKLTRFIRLKLQKGEDKMGYALRQCTVFGE